MILNRKNNFFAGGGGMDSRVHLTGDIPIRPK